MSYRWFEHAAELEPEIEASSEEGVFADALRALAEPLDGGRGAGCVSREVRISGPERAVQLAEWLDELVYLAETESLIAGDVERIELSDSGVEAIRQCRRGDPRHLVKVATYDRLAFERVGGFSRARVVLDV